MDGDGTVVECLIVGVAQHEGDIVDALAIHVVHGIATATAHTDDLDDAILFLGSHEVDYAEGGILICHNILDIEDLIM